MVPDTNPPTRPQGKTISTVRARREDYIDSNRRQHIGDRVHLYGAADWLKGGQIVSAYLTPEQAIDLASELIQYARIVQKDMRS